MKNAGILTIGNEILQGYTLDSNSNHISKELTIRNIDVTIQLTVPDVVSKIKEKIDKFIIKDYDYIFITGGLGPTHDDVTKKALLELFGCKLSFLEDRHNKLVQNFENYWNDASCLDLINDWGKINEKLDENGLQRKVRRHCMVCGNPTMVWNQFKDRPKCYDCS